MGIRAKIHCSDRHSDSFDSVDIWDRSLQLFKIEDTITEVNRLQSDRATMIDADRMLTRHFWRKTAPMQENNLEHLASLKTDNSENLQQTLDRILGPAEHFSEKMKPQLETFKTEYTDWKKHSEGILQLAAETAEENVQRADAAEQAIASFDQMRDIIDQLGALIDDSLKGELSQTRRLALEEAQSLVLNGDRDAYQAYVAQLLATNATDLVSLREMDEDSSGNIKQTKERVEKAAEILGGEGLALKQKFTDYFNSWQSLSRKAIALSLKDLPEKCQKNEFAGISAGHFDAMRATINSFGEEQAKQVDENSAAMLKMISTTEIFYITIMVISTLLSLLLASLLHSE